MNCHPPSIIDTLKNSVHKVLMCNDCHEGYEKTPHPEKKKLCKNCHTDVMKFFEKSVHFLFVSCFDCHGKHNITSFKLPGGKILITYKCSNCHKKEWNEYRESIHFTALKKGNTDAPACTDCHSEHYILPTEKEASPVYYRNVPKTCAHCHENKAITDKYGIPARRYSTYLKSYHGVFLEQGIPYVANCVSCHEAHFILPSSDNRSSIHFNNLPKTCGSCHPEADFKLTGGKIHVEAKREVSPYVFAVRMFYTIFISILVTGFLIHITFDIIRYIKKRRSNGK